VRPNGVIFLTPSFDYHLCLLERVEYLSVQQFVPQFAIETFIVAIFPRTAWLDVKGLDTQMP